MPVPDVTSAAVLRELGAALTVEEIALPKELEPGAVLVQVVASTVCGTDVHAAAGELAMPLQLPVVLGHEMVGRIVRLGTGADTDSFGQALSVGDRIIWTHAYCGECVMCSAKKPALCVNPVRYGFQSPNTFPYAAGGLAEHCYVYPRSGRVRVPDDVPDEWASMASCALRTVVNAFRQAGPVGATDTVVIQGCGPLGVLATGMVRVAGAGRVVTIGSPKNRLEVARAFGADDVVSLEETPDPADRIAAVRELSAGLGADVVLEFSGHAAAFGEGVAMLRTGGRYVVTGQLGPEATSFVPSEVTKRNLTIQGVLSADVDHYYGALRFLSRHRDSLPFSQLISDTYPLARVNEALGAMQRMEAMKPVVRAR